MTAKTQPANKDLYMIVGLAVLVVIGMIAWGMQLTQGFDVLGVGQAVAWGLYIAAFFLLAGIGAAFVILAACGDLGVLVALQGQRKSLLLGAIACFIAAGVMILMDIGNPLRVLYMLSYPNFKSMFIWDFYALALSVILSVVYLLVGMKYAWLPWVAGVVALAVMVVEGWILTVSAAEPLWHSGLIPVLFVAEGLIGALSILVLASGKVETLGKLLIGLLVAVLLFSIVELVSATYGGDPEASAAMGLLVGGSLAPLYWGQLALGVIVPIVLLGWFGKGRVAIDTAATLALLGVFVAKVDLLVAGQAIPFMQAPVGYVPTVVEVGGVIGILGLAGLLYVIANRYLFANAA
jgi:dimethyl sulfoxide reductase membrane subunit